jgi:hypothetical protein
MTSQFAHLRTNGCGPAPPTEPLTRTSPYLMLRRSGLGWCGVTRTGYALLRPHLVALRQARGRPTRLNGWSPADNPAELRPASARAPGCAVSIICLRGCHQRRRAEKDTPSQACEHLAEPPSIVQDGRPYLGQPQVVQSPPLSRRLQLPNARHAPERALPGTGPSPDAHIARTH